MAEPAPRSMIREFIARAIRETPELAVGDMLRLMEREAVMELEILELRSRVRELNQILMHHEVPIVR